MLISTNTPHKSALPKNPLPYFFIRCNACRSDRSNDGYSLVPSSTSSSCRMTVRMSLNVIGLPCRRIMSHSYLCNLPSPHDMSAPELSVDSEHLLSSFMAFAPSTHPAGWRLGPLPAAVHRRGRQGHPHHHPADRRGQGMIDTDVRLWSRGSLRDRPRAELFWRANRPRQTDIRPPDFDERGDVAVLGAFLPVTGRLIAGREPPRFLPDLSNSASTFSPLS
jgi:hypothetical protein